MPGQDPATVAPSSPVPGPPGRPDRAERLAALFAPPALPPPPAAPANDNDGDEEPAAKPRGKKSRVGWPWLAKRGTTVVDLVSGAAINAWTEREANDVGEVEREEFETSFAEWGEDSFGKVEAPAWIVLLLALVFLIVSKYVGAPKKEPEEKPQPKPAPIPPLASAVDTPAVPDAVIDAISPGMEAELPIPEPLPLQEKGVGNVDVAAIGF